RSGLCRLADPAGPGDHFSTATDACNEAALEDASQLYLCGSHSCAGALPVGGEERHSAAGYLSGLRPVFALAAPPADRESSEAKGSETQEPEAEGSERKRLKRERDRKSTRLNSSHVKIAYAV